MTAQEAKEYIKAILAGKDLYVSPEPSGSGLLSTISRRLVLINKQYYWEERTFDLREKEYFNNHILIGDLEALVTTLLPYSSKNIKLM